MYLEQHIALLQRENVLLEIRWVELVWKEMGENVVGYFACHSGECDGHVLMAEFSEHLEAHATWWPWIWGVSHNDE